MGLDEMTAYIEKLPTQLELPREADGPLTNISCGLKRSAITNGTRFAKQALVKLPENLTSDSQYEIRVSWKGIYPIKFHWRWACAEIYEVDRDYEPEKLPTHLFINKTFEQIIDHPDEKIVFRTDGDGLVNSGKTCEKNQEIGDEFLNPDKDMERAA